MDGRVGSPEANPDEVAAKIGRGVPGSLIAANA